MFVDESAGYSGKLLVTKYHEPCMHINRYEYLLTFKLLTRKQ